MACQLLPGIYATTELTVRPDAFDPHLDIEFEAEGKSTDCGVRCQHGDRRFEGLDAEAIPGASQLRVMGFSGAPSQL